MAGLGFNFDNLIPDSAFVNDTAVAQVNADALQYQTDANLQIAALAAQQNTQQQQLWLYIAIIAGVLILIGLLFYFLK